MNEVGKFEKVSLEQYMKDMEPFGLTPEEIKEYYDKIRLPRRATTGSAGYDFFAPFMFTIYPGMSMKVPTGIRVQIAAGWFLGCVPRSGLGFKHGLRLANTVAVIDSDYYRSSNEGHIFLKIAMPNKDDLFGSSFFFTDGWMLKIEQGESFAQGIFLPYGITVDDDADGVRNGGFGSTG